MEKKETVLLVAKDLFLYMKPTSGSMPDKVPEEFCKIYKDLVQRVAAIYDAISQ